MKPEPNEMTSANSLKPAEIRKDYLVDRWVVMAPSRSGRPEVLQHHDADLAAQTDERNMAEDPFLEGHEHLTPNELYSIANTPREKDSPGWNVRVFKNAFPALNTLGDPLLTTQNIHTSHKGVGYHEVIVDCPQYEEYFEALSVDQIFHVLMTYRDRMAWAYKQVEVNYVQVFKNQGLGAGASLPHAHSQLMTLPFIPPSMQAELTATQNYYATHNEKYMNFLMRDNAEQAERGIAQTTHFALHAPYASRFCFETCIFPVTGEACFHLCTTTQLRELAKVLKASLMGIARELPGFSYNLVIHSSPPEEIHMETYTWHLEILPRVTGIAGFEMGTGCYVNPVYPEEASQILSRHFNEFFQKIAES